MSVANKLLQAAAGNAGEAVYVDDVFSTYLYEGTNTSTAHQIQNGIDLDGEGGLVWIKKRDSNVTNTNHHLVDTERGDYYLASNSTNAQAAGSDINTFNSDGWTFDASTSLNTDYLGSDYVSWTFRKQPGFFDVVTYTGNGTAGRTVSHNLGSVPGMIIVKRLNSTGEWAVYHSGSSANPEQNYLWLNTTDSVRSSIAYWNDTAPTDSEFSVGTNYQVNSSGSEYVAYLFAHNDGDGEFGESGDQDIIKCGSYTGNGSADGPEIDLGFEPQWVMVKCSSSASTIWGILDSMRGITTGGADAFLEAQSSVDESLSNRFQVEPFGFKPIGGGSATNTNGQTYIYVAIRRPMKTPESGTEVFAVDNGEGNFDYPDFDSGFPVDWAFWKRPSNGSTDWKVQTRLTGATNLEFNTTNAEDTTQSADIRFDFMDGYYAGAKGTTDYAWMFKRATGFFDVVAYTGDGLDGRTVDHNLKVVPELIIVKSRTSAYTWRVLYYDGSSGLRLNLNDTSAGTTATGSIWGDSSSFIAPTSTQFTVSNYSNVNLNTAGFIAYLFATLDGISKVGSYTGTGSDVDVACGFTSGARFVLVKRTDSTGDWYVWDSARGIVAGNDPYLLLNSTAAEVTSTDYIDPLSSGFTITSSAPAALNASGGTYLFLAIA